MTNETTKPRYVTLPCCVITLLGCIDSGVWDNQDGWWVFKGSRDDCNEKATEWNARQEARGRQPDAQ